jgi:hypothetical protein
MEVLALLLTFAVHVAGAVFLGWALLGDDSWEGLRDWWPRDERPRDDAPLAPEPRPSGPGLPLPLADAASSPVRLREDGRIGDARPRRPRRPAHAPRPARAPRVPAGRQ